MAQVARAGVKLTETLEDRLAASPKQEPTNQQVQFIRNVGDPLKPQKVAIVGTQPSSRNLAPYGDPTWTIWGTSPGNMNCMPRVDAWVEMHVNFTWPQYFKSYGEAYINWLNAQTFPVIAQDQKLFPKAISYPIFEMVKRFGPYFFTSTFAYCMAYAIHLGVKEMALYGVDMSSKGEYIMQRPGGHFFLMKAREAGIKVIIPQESDLEMPPPLYGYSDASDYGRKQATRRFEVAERITSLDQQIASLSNQSAYLKGAQEDIDYNESIFASVEMLAVFKEKIREELIAEGRLLPVQAPPMYPSIPETPPPVHAPENVAGLSPQDVVKPSHVGNAYGDIFPDLRPRVPGKRKRGVEKRKRS